MKIENCKQLFGFWAGMPYGIVTDRYEDFEQFKNGIGYEKDPLKSEW